MNYAEVVTKRVLEAAFQGAVLNYRATQSHGEYDFDLHYSDGTTAAVEVTAAIDELLASTIGAIRNPRRGGSTIAASKCKKSWVLFPIRGANIRTIRADADDHLAKLEAEGIDSFFSPSARSTSVQEICFKLQVAGGGVISSEGNSSIQIALPGGGGAVGPSVAVRIAEVEAWKDDNRAKLGRAKTSERHLAVYVGPDNGLPWIAVTTFEPPPTPPHIPEEITDLWLIGQGESANSFVIWKWNEKDGWRKSVATC